MLKQVLSIFLFIYMVPNCNEQTSVHNPPPASINDAFLCGAAEENLKKLGCPEGNPTKAGKTFTEVCQNAENNFIWFNPKCLSTITSCDQVNTTCAVGQ